ncbi:MAG: VOC family protein [Candidatus Eisenbacteria bacterium]
MPRVVHFEIPADDPDKLAEFYKSVFGWTIQKWDGPVDYWLVMTGSKDQPGIDGGMGRKSDGMSAVVNTMDVPSVDEYVSKIEAAGGTITVPKMAIPGVGWMAYFKDPDGNVSGIMEEDASAK